MHCVLGLPTLLSMGAIINLLRCTLSCSEINFNFFLILNPPDRGLSDGASLDTSTSFIPPGIRSNILTHLQYTTMNSILPPVCDSTPSGNIVVKDNVFLNKCL